MISICSFKIQLEPTFNYICSTFLEAIIVILDGKTYVFVEGDKNNLLLPLAPGRRYQILKWVGKVKNFYILIDAIILNKSSTSFLDEAIGKHIYMSTDIKIINHHEFLQKF